MRFKRSLSLILALMLTAASVASCTKTGNDDETTGNGETSNVETTENGETTEGGGDTATATTSKGSVDVTQYLGDGYITENNEAYTEASSAIYDAVLGEFNEYYTKAKEADNLSTKFALMAVAEAKLHEAAVMLPCITDGGQYAISRLAPNTVNYALWGNDDYRYHQALVTTELIKTEDRAEMKAKWLELKGSGTYEQWAKDFLTEKGYTIKDSYTLGYTGDPQTWDVLATQRAADSNAIINTYDGLLEYDPEGILQPALATGLGEFSEPDPETGYVTVTYKLREGVTWVDSQGREVGQLTADDFVAGLQHMCDAAGGLEYLIEGIIVNASEYIYGEITDFNEVGVKAIDEHTLQYTLTGECTYFETMLGYGVFAPMNRAYYTSQGGQFGVGVYDPSAESYNYGKTPDTIAYCGPYVVTNYTSENTIVFSANESYWNKDNINVKTITWLFNDGSDVTKAYNDTLAGTLDGCGLNSSTLETARADGNFDAYHYISSTSTTSYMMFFNIFRQAYANSNDSTKVNTTLTEEQQTRALKAMGNVHFRKAIMFATDRATYNAQVVGEDCKLLSVRNSYVPGNFVTLEEDTTIDINGKATTFAAGTYYGAVMQAQLDADDAKITVWDPNGDDGLGSSDGFDGWYNVDNAVAELNLAIEELAADGITVDENNPIVIEHAWFSASATWTNKANAFKQSVEKALGGKVIINLLECVDASEFYAVGYQTEFGFEANYDTYDLSGWGPDYGDPQTYLDTFLPDYTGYMAKCVGIF